jgi:hypothetical protein
MLLRRLFTCRIAILALAPVLFAFNSSAARADHGCWGYSGCRCNPGCEVFSSDFYGYYRTCWRPWPGGQPECPVYILQPVPLTAAKETKSTESLPIPMPEVPASKPKSKSP